MTDSTNSDNVKDTEVSSAASQEQSSPAAVEDYRTVDERLEASSATSQLQDMLTNKAFDPAAAATPVEEQEETDEFGPGGIDSPIDWTIVGFAGLLIAAIVAWGLAAPESFASFSGNALSFVVNNFGWAYVLFGTIFVIFVICIAASKFGTIRLGKINEEPEFSTVSWIAMMFAAGMGIGLMFYGASEPLNYFKNGVPGHSEHEVGTSMATAMFHWTLHPWAVYAIVGLAIAYSTFRIGRKQLLSQAFVPLIGQRAADGFVGKIIDILAIFATVFGTACSLGLGAMQIQAGLEASGIIENPTQKVVIGIVLVLTLAFLLSAMSGVGKGIQYLSNTNMVLAALLAIFVFIFGPTVSILNQIPGSIGNYLANFTEMIARTAESDNGTAGEWLSTWTIFYWAWWVSWSPFVGMFLARISVVVPSASSALACFSSRLVSPLCGLPSSVVPLFTWSRRATLSPVNLPSRSCSTFCRTCLVVSLQASLPLCCWLRSLLRRPTRRRQSWARCPSPVQPPLSRGYPQRGCAHCSRRPDPAAVERGFPIEPAERHHRGSTAIPLYPRWTHVRYFQGLE